MMKVIDTELPKENNLKKSLASNIIELKQLYWTVFINRFFLNTG